MKMTKLEQLKHVLDSMPPMEGDDSDLLMKALDDLTEEANILNTTPEDVIEFRKASKIEPKSEDV